MCNLNAVNKLSPLSDMELISPTTIFMVQTGSSNIYYLHFFYLTQNKLQKFMGFLLLFV